MNYHGYLQVSGAGATTLKTLLHSYLLQVTKKSNIAQTPMTVGCMRFKFQTH